jgi:hypothetical protein
LINPEFQLQPREVLKTDGVIWAGMLWREDAVCGKTRPFSARNEFGELPVLDGWLDATRPFHHLKLAIITVTLLMTWIFTESKYGFVNMYSLSITAKVSDSAVVNRAKGSKA